MKSSTPESDFPWFRRKGLWLFVLGLMTGIAMSAVFAIVVRVGSRGDGRPVVAQAAPSRRLAEPVQPTTPVDLRPGEKAPITPSPGPPKPQESRESVSVPPPAIASIPPAPERFVLQDAPRVEPDSFRLPTDPWFALGSVSADEPAVPEPPVCRVDRSLDTALTWARSPAEASEQAARQGKLVFLIHVSGNFEDPGFT